MSAFTLPSKSFSNLTKAKTSSAASCRTPNVQAKSCSSVICEAKESAEAWPAPIAAEESCPEDQHRNVNQESLQKAPPETFATNKSSALRELKSMNKVGPSHVDSAAASTATSPTVAVTVGLGGPSQAEESEGSTFNTAESVAKSASVKDISVSERSSMYQTAAEVGGLRRPWHQVLRGESRKSPIGGTPLDFLREYDPPERNTVTKISPQNKDAAKTSPSSTTPESAAAPSSPDSRTFEERGTNSENASHHDKTASASIQASNNAGSQPVAGKSAVAAKEGSKEDHSSSLSERKETHRTPSSFKEWPKHESETIPDPARIIFMRTQPEELPMNSSGSSAGRGRSLVLTKTAQALSLNSNGQPVYWESLFDSNARTSSQAPTAKEISVTATETLRQSENGDNSGASSGIEKAEHKKTLEIKRTSSADLVNVVLETNSSLYSPHFLLNFDEDQIEDPTPKGAAGVRRTFLRASQAQQLSPPLPCTEQQIQISPASQTLPMTSTATRGGQSGDPAQPSKALEVTRSVSSILSDIVVAVTSRRYWTLLTFCVLSMINAFQWIQYSIIASVIKDHYGVSDATISWTSMMYLIGYMMLAFPSAWILDNMGLRITVLLGAIGTAIGACIKMFAVKPGQFSVVLVGQAFPAFAQAFILGIPPRLSSAWFKYEEISTACSLGVLGNNLGIALGFVIPPNVVHADDVERSLLYLSATVAVVSVLCLFVILVAFQDKPEHPPSHSEMLTRLSTTKPSFFASFGALLGDFDFRLLVLSYGLNTGAFYSLSTLLNPVILAYFPGEEAFAGWLGLALIVAGLVGSWLCGMALDRTGKYKEVTLFTYIFSTVGLFAYTFILSVRSHLLSLAACIFLGFFMTGYIPIGLQLAAEITYPMPEGMSSNIMNVSAQAIGFLMILGSSYIQEAYGDVVSNLCLVALLDVGCLMTVHINARLKRQKAYREGVSKRESIARTLAVNLSPTKQLQSNIPSDDTQVQSDPSENRELPASGSANVSD